MAEIKLEKRLPDLLPGDLQIVNEAIMEAYEKGKADAKEQLCRGCIYKGYYARVASQNDCNDCGAVRTCQHVPRAGSVCRINCPLWRPKG